MKKLNKLFAFCNKKTIPFIAIALAVILIGAGTTIAYLLSQTWETVNEFVPAKVTCEVEESFANGVKEDVVIKNTGNVNAFVRAAVIVNYVSNTDGKIYHVSPKETVDYTIEWGSDWIKASDGFWYYPSDIAPNAATAKLIKTAKSLSAPQGYSLNIQIIATAIQSEPLSAVTDAWGVAVNNNLITVQ